MQSTFSSQTLLDYNDVTRIDPINVNIILHHLMNQGKLTDRAVLYINEVASNLFQKEANVVDLNDNVETLIIGDTHGQFYDTVSLLEKTQAARYVFLGDYVDRGEFGVELVLMLFSLKISSPKRFIFLRGNHESRAMSEKNTFKAECLSKYNEEIYESFISVFQTLPIAAVVNNKYFCVHGNVTPGLTTIAAINELNRFCEPEKGTQLGEMLWNDPINEEEMYDASLGKYDYAASTINTTNNDLSELNNYFKGKNLEEVKKWMTVESTPNTKRNWGKRIGYSYMKQFLLENQLTSIIRGHEYEEDGYKEMYYMIEDIPILYTVFSAPNYFCGRYVNLGAYLIIKNGDVKAKKFRGVSLERTPSPEFEKEAEKISVVV
ncbi:serine/threonine protein phosphatase 2B catalytic subunit A2, putative [Entamoeba invadens IP1]|uniref:Serine/threonine-protein phosphatase n=1 Tax=Entamoeba invadens IP1 TaxID=370355 RepID=A0A0A1UDD4_ENTIV|nr:serine/threonine protein phosphatase 2B catalytic subunit A2, putative [Entamoeba invadens IP1]ELP94459.1 serine/threonine protein phosphatase 2B catalytic subunit A2, putative [Entamoeba invadens IP1]|eukprot:XP_004261230.1 serine/threonine protein phosphatase 2B catalytic subunit A2, putative [Entamoeba invadens IP1]